MHGLKFEEIAYELTSSIICEIIYSFGKYLPSAFFQNSIIYVTRLPVTRWVKLSLNFELLVNRVMKFLLGQRLFNNNIFCTTCIIPYPRKQPCYRLKLKKKN